MKRFLKILVLLDLKILVQCPRACELLGSVLDPPRDGTDSILMLSLPVTFIQTVLLLVCSRCPCLSQGLGLDIFRGCLQP